MVTSGRATGSDPVSPAPPKGGGDGDTTLKKGTWTAEEDAILVEYVRRHGEGNWNAVQRNSGLNRCGKSCRLRWANHLRPNLKKGSFSPEEERLIIELHAKLGNKWARMASMLPGRTDNEIKNYWNTRIKKRSRQRLPLYSDHHPSLSAPTTPTVPAFPLQYQSYPFPQTPPNPSPHSPLPPSPHSSFHTPNHNTNPSAAFTFQRPTPILSSPISFKRFCRGSSESFLPHPPTSITIPQNQYKHNHMTSPNPYHLSNPESMDQFSFNILNKDHSEFNMGLLSLSLELSNSEIVSPRRKRQVLMNRSMSENTNMSSLGDQNTTALLDDLLADACCEKLTEDNVFGSQNENERLQQQFHQSSLGSDNVYFWDSSSPIPNAEQSNHDTSCLYQNAGKAMEATYNQQNIDCSPVMFTGQKEMSEDSVATNLVNSMDNEDLTKLLNFLPSSMEIPEWFSTSGSGETSRGQSSSEEQVNNNNMGIEQMQNLGSGSCSWENLSEICNANERA